MDDAKELWSWWQSLLIDFQPQFTRGGWVRFGQWVTGMVLCDEEHTITQILTTVGLESRWRVVESFAEYGSWDREAVERQLLRTIGDHQLCRRGGYRVVAIDDTKGHRTSADVWGSCTFHESTARSPNRAETVRAHNWVVMGELVPGKPWTYLPCASRLYFRKSQTPVGEVFRTKTSWAVDMMREVDDESDAPILAAFDGAYAMETVIRPCLNPPEGHRRIEFVTRLRKDARLYHPLTPSKKNPKGGRPRKWGRRMAAPQNHEKWDADWQNGRAYLYGRIRNFRYKRVLCQWAVAGPEHLLYAYVFEVSGYKEPVLRTFQVQITAQTLLRLMQFRLDEQWGEQSWWSPPPWNPKKRHPSILDLRRLFWRHRDRFSKFLVRLEEMAKPPQAHFPCGRPTARAA